MTLILEEEVYLIAKMSHWAIHVVEMEFVVVQRQKIIVQKIVLWGILVLHS